MQTTHNVNPEMPFFSEDEKALAEEFLESGYIIHAVDDREALDALRHEVVSLTAQFCDCALPEDEGAFLNEIHDIVPVDRLNDLRLSVYRAVNALDWVRPTYFKLGQTRLEQLVGNELAMQNRINLSIQMPGDTSSLLDIHADVFSGETPYQVVQWLPLVDVGNTKSMFILPRKKSEDIVQRLNEFANDGMSGVYQAVKDDLLWLDIPYGNVLIFSPNCLHGNVVNREPTTRWSINCRFTGLFTPYNTSEKSLGSFYLPITPRPVTKLGMDYRQPDGFRE